MLPAPGQGALAIECRAVDVEPGGRLRDLLAPLDDPSSRAAVIAERAVLAAPSRRDVPPLSGHLPRSMRLSDLHLVAAVVSVDGMTAIRGSAQGAGD